MPKRYNNSPIIEALCEFQFDELKQTFGKVKE
jgi:hypothetical protein